MNLKQPPIQPGLLAVCMGISAGIALAGIRDGWHELVVGVNIVAFTMCFVSLVFHNDFGGPDDYDNFTF